MTSISDDEKQRILGRVDVELHRSMTKHGDWSDYDYDCMTAKIEDELAESEEAMERNDHHGPHGSLAELSQVIVTSMKAMVQIMRREGIQP